jgi:hypothetical protein
VDSFTGKSWVKRGCDSRGDDESDRGVTDRHTRVHTCSASHRKKVYVQEPNSALSSETAFQSIVDTAILPLGWPELCVLGRESSKASHRVTSALLNATHKWYAPHKHILMEYCSSILSSTVYTSLGFSTTKHTSSDVRRIESQP